MIGVLAVKFHYVYRIFKDPGDLEHDFIYDDEQTDAADKENQQTDKKDK